MYVEPNQDTQRKGVEALIAEPAILDNGTGEVVEDNTTMEKLIVNPLTKETVGRSDGKVHVADNMDPSKYHGPDSGTTEGHGSDTRYIDVTNQPNVVPGKDATVVVSESTDLPVVMAPAKVDTTSPVV